MNTRRYTLALIGAALLSLGAGAVCAASPPEPSALALPAGALALAEVAAPIVAAPDVAVMYAPALPSAEYIGIHYRPRSAPDTGTSTTRGYQEIFTRTQIYGGVFQLTERPDHNAAMGGLRVGPLLGRHAQLGVLFDWTHSTSQESTNQSQVVGPGGVPINGRYDLSRSSTDVFPLLAFVQLSGWGKLFLMPYVGAGGGYQWVNLYGEDYVNNRTYDATFGGWGWQAWGGVGMPIASNVKLTGEVFISGAHLGRDVPDPYNVIIYHESIDMDGVGARFGLAWGL
jgi:hypothetical protein